MSETLDCRDGNCDACEVCDHDCQGLALQAEDMHGLSRLGVATLVALGVAILLGVVGIGALVLSAVTR